MEEITNRKIGNNQLIFGEYGMSIFKRSIHDIYGENCLECAIYEQQQELIECFNSRSKLMDDVSISLEKASKISSINLNSRMDKDKVEFELLTNKINSETLKAPYVIKANFYSTGEVIVSMPKKIDYKKGATKNINKVTLFLEEKVLLEAQEKVLSVLKDYGQEPKGLTMLQGSAPEKKRLRIKFKR
jgi:hypothetical protein